MSAGASGGAPPKGAAPDNADLWRQHPSRHDDTWAWRGVEAQHVVSTMRLVDRLTDQALLEQMLEESKPAPPAEAQHSHYLLFTPFRYRSPYASRFRRATDPGLWYGAEQRRTACAEVAWWRWRFLTDSTGLQQQELLSEHTLFRARVQGPVLDLLQPPWSAAASRWSHPQDYAATQGLAAQARERQVAWIRYASAREPGGTCCAVLSPGALTDIDLASQHTGHCRTTRTGVRMIHQQEGYEWWLAADGSAGGIAPN